MSLSFESNYLDLVSRVIVNNNRRTSRAGDTLQVFGAHLVIQDLKQGYFPVLTSRKIYYKPVLGELAAFLKGSTDLADFKRFSCNYWDDNAKAWERNKDVTFDFDLSVGKIYGYQWRRWNGTHDQIANLVEGLLTNPFGRRHLLTTYNPTDLQDACLPPCHILAQFNVTNEGELDCIVYMRSVDLCLGLPSDIVLYAALLLLVCDAVKLKPGNLIFMMGDAHVYENHVESFAKQVKRLAYIPPTWELHSTTNIFNFHPSHLTLTDYTSSEPIKYEFNV